MDIGNVSFSSIYSFLDNQTLYTHYRYGFKKVINGSLDHESNSGNHCSGSTGERETSQTSCANPPVQETSCWAILRKHRIMGTPPPTKTSETRRKFCPPLIYRTRRHTIWMTHNTDCIVPYLLWKCSATSISTWATMRTIRSAWKICQFSSYYKILRDDLNAMAAPLLCNGLNTIRRDAFFLGL